MKQDNKYNNFIKEIIKYRKYLFCYYKNKTTDLLIENIISITFKGHKGSNNILINIENSKIDSEGFSDTKLYEKFGKYESFYDKT
jgi:hypothetical protein